MASDLISRDAVLNIVDNEWYKYKDKDGLFEIAACTLMKSLFDDVERIEAVDAEPVRHAEWIPWEYNGKVSKYFVVCSACKRYQWPRSESATFRRCPKCGAKMNGGAK